MIVYIVTSGSYTKGPREIKGVFAEREQAENYCAICEDVCFDDMFVIEEWDTDAIHIGCKNKAKAEWTMNVNPNGEVGFIGKRYVFRDTNTVEEGEFADDGWTVRKTFDSDMPEDQVRAAMLKRLGEWKETHK